MSDRTFNLEIVTPDRVVFSDGGIASAVLPGAEGYFGVLGNHAPLVAELGTGQLDFRRADGATAEMALSNGFAEVFENKVTVLADSAEFGREIDVGRAEAARKRAEERIAAHEPNIDHVRAEAALKRAINRLRVAEKAV